MTWSRADGRVVQIARAQDIFHRIRSNSNCPRETLLHLERHLERIHEDEGRVVVIGQSLGGVYARELAARRPELVERVITLGSPVRLVEDSANALVIVMARLVARLRNMEAGCLTRSCACGMMLVERIRGEIPTTVIYSKTDGVVHWDSCIDRSGAKTVENLEVSASHVGMGVNTEVLRIVADRLARAPRTVSPETRRITGCCAVAPETSQLYNRRQIAAAARIEN